MTSGMLGDEARLATRVGGAMMLAGAALGMASVVLPPRASGSDALVVVLVLIAAGVGIALLRSRYVLPQWLLGATIGLGTVLITLATFEGGTLNTGTDDNEMFYVWICLLAFNFLTLRHALLQLALVAVAYALLLSDTPFGEAATRWLISITTLLLAGLLLYRLRSSRERLVSELSERADNDGLTGLLNRAALEARAKVELARARRDDLPLSLIVLDLDDFKEYNDGNGHPAGDALLRTVARGLREETRQVDALARLGGDEFAVLLPGASEEDAMLVAHRLQEVAWAQDGSRGTLSIGVGATRGETDFEGLWHDADSAMYEAKRAGGDSVRAASEAGEPEAEPTATTG